MAMNTKMPSDIKLNPIYRDIWKRIYHYNKNYMAVFCGGTGDGKSYSALNMAHTMDRSKTGEHRFSMDNVVFLPSEFLVHRFCVHKGKKT